MPAHQRLALLNNCLATGTPSPRAAVTSPVRASIEHYGKARFRGAVADHYLRKFGEDASLLENPGWTKDKADVVAAAVLEWAIDNDADTFCHCWQPMAASGVRHGQVAMVQNKMVEFNGAGQAVWDFKGKALLKGETDGSSFPNGGMRATHTAGGYLSLDPESSIFLRGDTIFIPACFISWNGSALDEKTPLHRATQAMSHQGTRLLSLMGLETSGLINNIGLEQEVFLVPREAYYKRPDLQFCGRTLTGHMPARGQELSDHYMAAISSATAAGSFFREVQEQCFVLGIPLKTRHREVAPGQYEMAPLFGPVVEQVDQNLMVMQIMEEVAAKHGLACLIHEKPFAGINGSGKHNNWSIATAEGAQLLVPGSINAASGNPDLFPLVMSCIVAAVKQHGDLMRMAIASPGNDFRLGAMEAPPAVMSTYLGADMTEYLEAYMGGATGAEYTPTTKPLSFGVDSVGQQGFEVPTEDRNRTSPFPYGGGRFEFRAVGSTQNVSLVNTVLNTIAAAGFKAVADRIEAGEAPSAIAQSLLKDNWNAIFNGNGYDPAWPDLAVEKGLWRIDSGVDAIKEFTSAKNIELFSSMGVFTAEECAARRAVLLGFYTGTVEMECNTLIDMINQHVLPSLTRAGMATDAVAASLSAVEAGLASIHHEEDEAAQASLCRVVRLETMVAAREAIDTAEATCPADLWSLASYKELLFLDSHTVF